MLGFCLIILVLAAIVGVNEAQQMPEGMSHPLTNMPLASEDVEVTSILPDHPDSKLPLGEILTVLCQVANNGEAPLNISVIMGSLNSPVDFNFHIQNFSIKPFGAVVQPGTFINIYILFLLYIYIYNLLSSNYYFNYNHINDMNICICMILFK